MTAVIAQPFRRSTGPKSATGISGPGLITGTERAADGDSVAGAVTRSDRRLCGMSPGRLLLAATPLGLPADASARLIEALGSADVVAAEDTRRVRTLAQALDVRIAGRVVSLFDQNEATRVPALVDEIKGGATVLVVSDAGMPSINDPGYRLVVGLCRGRAAGELPARPVGGDDGAGGLGAARRPVLFRGLRAAQAVGAQDVAGRPGRRTAHRACSSSRRAGWRTACATPSRCSGRERRAVVCRELTKTHEEVMRGSLAELAEWAADGVLGEITVVLAGATAGGRSRDAGGRGDPRSSTTACGSRTRARR